MGADKSEAAEEVEGGLELVGDGCDKKARTAEDGAAEVR